MFLDQYCHYWMLVIHNTSNGKKNEIFVSPSCGLLQKIAFNLIRNKKVKLIKKSKYAYFMTADLL